MFMRHAAAVLVMLFACCMAPNVHAEPIQIKFSHVVDEDAPKGKMANKFRDLVAERMGDKVEVVVYPNSKLFNDNAVLQAMLLGDAQMAAPALSKFQKYTGVLQLYDLPFLFKDMKAVDCFQDGEHGQAMLRSMTDKGLLGLGYLHNGMKQLSAFNPLRVPADAEGKRFRIMSSDVLVAQFEAVGAFPMKKPFSEVFSLLMTHALDGQENTWVNMFTRRLYLTQPYITESNHGLLDYLVVTSTEFWNGLPEDVSAGLHEALQEAVAYGNSESSKLAEEAKQQIIDSGRCELLQLSDAERAQWVEAMKPVWGRFADEIGQENIDAAQACN